MARPQRRAKGEPLGKCWTCSGTGQEIAWVSRGGKTEQIRIVCTDCGGTGEKR